MLSYLTVGGIGEQLAKSHLCAGQMAVHPNQRHTQALGYRTHRWRAGRPYQHGQEFTVEVVEACRQASDRGFGTHTAGGAHRANTKASCSATDGRGNPNAPPPRVCATST